MWAATAGAQTSTTSSDEATDPPPRRSTATPASGTCQRPRCCARSVLGERVSRRLQLPRRIQQRLRYRRRRSDTASRNGIELFTSFKLDTRIDRDLRPLFTSNRTVGGVNPRYPNVTRGWSGDNVGDWTVGIKINFMNEERQHPVAVALQGDGQDSDRRRGGRRQHRQARHACSTSSSARKSGEWSSSRRTAAPRSAARPTRFPSRNGLRWGVGAGFPSHSPLRVTGELHGEQPFDDTVTLSSPVHRDRRQPRAHDVGSAQLHGRDRRADLAAPARVLRRRRADLEPAEGESRRVRHRRRRKRRLRRLSVPDRLSARRRPDVRAATAAGRRPDTAAEPAAGKPAADGDGAMRAVHG